MFDFTVVLSGSAHRLTQPTKCLRVKQEEEELPLRTISPGKVPLVWFCMGSEPGQRGVSEGPKRKQRNCSDCSLVLVLVLVLTVCTATPETPSEPEVQFSPDLVLRTDPVQLMTARFWKFWRPGPARPTCSGHSGCDVRASSLLSWKQ